MSLKDTHWNFAENNNTSSTWNKEYTKHEVHPNCSLWPLYIFIIKVTDGDDLVNMFRN